MEYFEEEETAVGEIGEKIRQQELERKKRETVGQKLDQGIEKVNETGKGISGLRGMEKYEY